jgi:hypothetical protein
VHATALRPEEDPETAEEDGFLFVWGRRPRRRRMHFRTGRIQALSERPWQKGTGWDEYGSGIRRPELDFQSWGEGKRAKEA